MIPFTSISLNPRTLLKQPQKRRKFLVSFSEEERW